MSGETFAAMLKRLREARPGDSNGNRFVGRRRCISQRSLARLAEVDPAFVNRLEAGRASRGEHPQVPSKAIVHSLAQALRCDPLTTDRLMIAAGYWPWDDQQDVERALEAVHGDFYGRRTG